MVICHFHGQLEFDVAAAVVGHASPPKHQQVSFCKPYSCPWIDGAWEACLLSSYVQNARVPRNIQRYSS